LPAACAASTTSWCSAGDVPTKTASTATASTIVRQFGGDAREAEVIGDGFAAFERAIGDGCDLRTRDVRFNTSGGPASSPRSVGTNRRPLWLGCRW